MREEIERMVAVGKLRQSQVEPLVEMATEGFCLHRKWGCGKITTVDTVAGKLTIDFEGKPGHLMDMGFASELLKPVKKTHVLARKITELDELKKLAALDHLELIKAVLMSYDGACTVSQIQDVLVPDVISDDWKKWWDAVKKELKQNPHFSVPIKKSDNITYHSEQVSIQERLMQQMTDFADLKAKMTVVGEVLKSIEELDDPKGAAEQINEQLNQQIQFLRNTQADQALEGIFIRDEVNRTTGFETDEGATTDKEIWEAYLENFSELIQGISASKQKVAIQSLQVCYPDDWKEMLLNNINEFQAKLVGESAKAVIADGALIELKEILFQLIKQNTASSELLLWLAKDRNDSFQDILGPDVFRAMLAAIERDQFNEVKSNRLADYILNDKELIDDLIEAADIEIIQDLVRTLQFSPSFPDLEKRSIFARFIRLYPSIQTLITKESGSKEENKLVVSFVSLERRREEYQDLVRNKIPANSKEIAVARSYGDLKENHEYKSAKEMQRILMARKSELEGDLLKAEGTDFANVPTGSVNIGTQVTVYNEIKDREEVYSIFGAWDTDVDKGVISYLTPMAKNLMNKKVGDKVSFELGGRNNVFVVKDIAKADTSLIPEKVGETSTSEKEA